MKKKEIRIAHKDDFPEIARLIAEESKIPEYQCIHSSIGKDPESILREMVKWNEIDEIFFAIALENERLTGVIGSEYDEDLGKGWLWGPYVVAGNWEETAKHLIEALLYSLPDTIQRLYCFLNIKNQRGFRFYLNHGFEKDDTAHVYSAQFPETPYNLIEPCLILKSEHAEGFSELHSTIFPNAYFSAGRIIDMLDDDHRVFVYTADGRVHGYVYASVMTDSQGGEIEFLGVRETKRGQGIGKRLLLTALKWLHKEKGVSPVELVVSKGNTNARSLYEEVGFKLQYTGVSARLEIDRAKGETWSKDR